MPMEREDNSKKSHPALAAELPRGAGESLAKRNCSRGGTKSVRRYAEARRGALQSGLGLARARPRRSAKYSKTKTRTTFSPVTSQAASFTPPKTTSVVQGKIMTDSISDASVALSLMREALSLLDAPEHSNAAAHLNAINELSPRSGRSCLHFAAQETLAGLETASRSRETPPSTS